MAQSLAATALCSMLWVVVGYSLTFTGDGAVLGTLDRVLLHGMGMDAISPLAKTIPEALFMIYQMTFAVITVALVAGSVADRMRFSAFVLVRRALADRRLCADRALGLGRRLSGDARACSISPAAPWCISMPASPAWSPPMCSARAAATARDNLRALRPVAGGDRHRPAVGRLVRLQRRLGARRQFARRVRDRRHASCGLAPARSPGWRWNGGRAASHRCSA